MNKRVGANQRMKRKDRKKQIPKNIKGAVGRVFSIGKWLCLVLILCIAGFFGSKKAMVYMQGIDFLTIQNITVVGIENIDTVSILKKAEIEKGISLFSLKISAIKKRLLKENWVKKVRIKRKLPETIVISILEREPMALINRGEVYFVDKSGFLWPLKSHTFWNLPIVSGLKDTIDNKGKMKLIKNDIETLEKFLSEIYASKEVSHLTISQLDFSPDNQVQVKFDSSPLTVMFDCKNAGKRVKHLWNILNMVEKNAANMPKYINLCYNNIAFVR